MTEFLSEMLLGAKSAHSRADGSVGAVSPHGTDGGGKARTLVRKLVVFAHHKDVMDAIQVTAITAHLIHSYSKRPITVRNGRNGSYYRQKTCLLPAVGFDGHIRIDGDTPILERHALCQSFARADSGVR